MNGLDNALDNLIGKRSGQLLSVLRIVSAFYVYATRHAEDVQLSGRSKP